MIRTNIRLTYANGYIDLGMFKEAQAELEEIAEPDCSQAPSVMMWNKLHLTAGNWSELVQVSRELTVIAPEEAFGWVNWAYALRELADAVSAKKVAEKALDRHPKEAVILYNLACYCSLLSEFETARSYLDAAIQIDDSFAAEFETDRDLDGLRDHENHS